MEKWIIYLVLLTVTSTAVVSGQTCQGTQTSSACYVISTSPKSWSAAQSDCKAEATSMGRPNFGFLTSLQDQTQNDYVETLMKDVIALQTSFAGKDALRVMWVGGLEESSSHGARSPPVVPTWRWLNDETNPLLLQGCFKDNPSNRDFESETTFTDLRPQTCIDYCYNLGYSVAAVRDGSTCGCGRTGQYGQLGTDPNCVTTCSSGFGYCGGTNLNHVYIINGSFADWTSNQPNDYAGYQPCGHIEKYTGFNKFTLGDKFCREALNYVCELPASDCTSGTSYAYTSGSRCIYYDVFQRLNWYKAREACRAKGGDLIAADTADVMAGMSSILTNTLQFSDPMWVGATGRKWLWDDGQEFLYTKFPMSHPINKDYNCLELFSNQQNVFQWQDADCTKALPYICYIDTITPLPTTTTTTTTTTTKPPTTPTTTTSSSGNGGNGGTGGNGVTGGTGNTGSTGTQKTTATTKTTTGTTTTTRVTTTPTTTTSTTTSSTTSTDGNSTTTEGTTTTTAPSNGTDPNIGASTGGGGLGSTTTYILVGVIVAVIVVVIVVTVIVFHMKKKQRETANFVHPDKGTNVYMNPELPSSDRSTQPFRGIDESSTVTASNINTDVSGLPDITRSSRVYESRFKLDPISADNERKSVEFTEPKKPKKEKKRREKTEGGEEGKDKKKHRKKKRSHKEAEELPQLGGNVVVDMGMKDHLY